MHICVCVCMYLSYFYRLLEEKEFLKAVSVSCEFLFLIFNEFPWCFAAEGEVLVTGLFGSFAFCFTLFLVFQQIKKSKSSNI